ncbi:MAG: T9SS type A sorting domain-containing protein [Bacteroidota bacterium]
MAQYVLDSDFGEGGHVYVAEDSVTTVVHGLSLEGDAMLVLSQVGPVGTSVADRDVLLSKFDSEGELDHSFGQGGQLRFDFDSLSYSTGIFLMEDIDGSFLVLGSGKTDSNSDRTWGCVQRVSADGTPLPLSAQLSALRYEVMGLEEYPNTLHRDAADRYLIAGSTFDPIGNHAQPVVLRYSANWAIDSSFGGTGKILFDFGATVALRGNAVHFSGGFIRDLMVLPDSGIAICGALSNGNHYSGFIAGIRKDGMLETDFCPPYGYAEFDLFNGYDTRIKGMALLPDGTLAFGGATHPSNPDAELLLGRLNPANGSFTYEKIDLGDTQVEFDDLLLGADGGLRMLATGENTSTSSLALIHIPDPEHLQQHSIARFTPDSSLSISGNFMFAQSNRILFGGFQRTSSPPIRGFLSAVHVPLTFAPASVQSTTDFSIFPNPARDHFTIRSSESIRDVSLYTLHGKRCFTQTGGIGKETTIQLPFLPAGTYILSVNHQSRKKIILR